MQYGFSSLDLDLVRGAPDSRRSWIDGLLIQLETRIFQHFAAIQSGVTPAQCVY